MSLPKVLISSTCYDLEEVRNAIKQSVLDIGYEPILSDQSDVLYDPTEHTHVSCIKVIEEVDIIVLVITERFGGKAIPSAIDLIKLQEESSKGKDFFKNVTKGQVSITQLEILKAYECGVPVFAFIKDTVVTFHQLYQTNKNKPMLKDISFPGFKGNEGLVFEFMNYLRFREKNNAYFIYKNSTDLIEQFKKQMAHFVQKLLKDRKKTRVFSDEFVNAKIVAHISDERNRAFQDLFTEIDRDDEIKILGTGVTKFLGREEEIENYLKNNNNIKILLVNDQIIKSDWYCTSEKFINKLNEALVAVDEVQIGELNVKTHCPLADLNFLVDNDHFNNYYKRDKYVDKVKESHGLIRKFQELAKKEGWTGKLEAKHFHSFVPLSITAVFPDHSDNKKLLAEFIIPFTDNRIILKSSPKMNENIYSLFMDFFDETWKRAKPI